MAIFLNDGLDDLTRLMLTIDNSANYYLKLYTNNYTPSLSSVTANFTECALAGYADIVLTPSDWTGSTSGGVSTYSYPQQKWTFDSYTGSTVTIYGWYLWNQTTTNTILAEAFSTPYTVPLTGGEVLLTLTWNDQNCS